MGDTKHISTALWYSSIQGELLKNLLSWIKASFKNLLEKTTSRNSPELPNTSRICLANKNVCFKAFMTYRKSFFKLFLK